MNLISIFLMLFLTYLFTDSLFVDSKGIFVVPFGKVGDDTACDAGKVDILLYVDDPPKAVTNLTKANENYGVLLLSTTSKSDEGVYLDKEFRQRYPIGLIDSDAIFMSETESAINPICSKYHVIAIDRNETGGDQWNCLKILRNRSSSVFQSKTLEANMTNFSYKALCVSKYQKSPTVVADAFIGYRLCGNILAPSLYIMQEGQDCNVSLLTRLFRHYDAIVYHEDEVITLCYICPYRGYAIYNVTEMISGKVTSHVHHCQPVNSAKSFYVSLYTKTVHVNQFHERILNRIFFEDFHKEYLIEFTFTCVTGMNLNMSSKPAPIPNQYELTCAFRKPKDIRLHSNAFYVLSIKEADRAESDFEPVFGREPSVFAIVHRATTYFCQVTIHFSGPYAMHEYTYLAGVNYTIVAASDGIWGDLKGATFELIITYVLICVIASALIVALTMFCCHQFKSRAAKQRLAYLTGDSYSKTRINDSFDKKTISFDETSEKLNARLDRNKTKKTKSRKFQQPKMHIKSKSHRLTAPSTQSS